MNYKALIPLTVILMASCADESSTTNNVTNVTYPSRIDDTYNITIQNVLIDPFEIDEPTSPGYYPYQRSWPAGTTANITGSFEIKNSGDAPFAGVIGIQYTSNGAYVQIQWGQVMVNLAPNEVKAVNFNKELNLPGTSINIEEIPNPQYFRIFINSDDNSVYTGGTMRFDVDLDDNLFSYEYFYRVSGGG